MSKYDIIIIGSGLGGLECGAILSKEGYHVCVLEKNELFGGCFQTYQRGGHRMDTGIHYIGSLDEGQIMNQYFRYFGIMDKLSIQRMDEEGFDRIYYKNAIYDYAMGHERFMETLCHSFPHERENLKRDSVSAGLPSFFFFGSVGSGSSFGSFSSAREMSAVSAFFNS